jgi:sec-independent protein translocase protein TatB
MMIQPGIQAANIGMADSLVLMVMALVVFGPRRLPQIGRQIGKLMYEFRKASNDFKFQMEEEMRNAEEADRRKKEEERLAALTLTTTPEPEKKEPEGQTHLLDTGEGAPEYYEAAKNENPYPYEGDFPAATPPAAEQEAGTPAAAEPEASTPAEQATPKILPPATGQPVPYGGAAETATEMTTETTAETASANGAEPAADEGGTVTEQAAHHG